MDKVIFCFIIFVLAEKVVSAKRHLVKVNDGKIVGGYNTTIENVPYQVYLLVQVGTKYYQCGGSIISPRYVLTAAHCLSGVSQIQIRAGSVNANIGGQSHTTITYVQHPLYNARTSDYDVGLIRLQRRMTIDNTTTKAVKMADSNSSVPAGQDLLVTGWGATSENGATTTGLMAVVVKTISDDECRKTYSYLTKQMFCAGFPEGGKDSCQGDSGGPAVLTSSGILAGIVSFGNGCARPGNPGVYTRVGAPGVRNWIRLTSGL